MTGGLAGTRLLVVGASSGIGRAVGMAAAAQGAAVAFAARREDQVRAAAREAGSPSIAVVGDVSVAGDCWRIADEAASSLDGLDGLVYAAAHLPLATLVDTDARTWHTVWATNVTGAALVTAASMPHLTDSAGRVVYLSSDAVDRPRPGLGAYAASKAALDALLLAWRGEHPDVSFTRVSLGATDTGVPPSWDPSDAGAWLDRWVDEGHPAGQHGVMTPDQVAAQIVAALAAPVRIDDLALQPRAV